MQTFESYPLLPEIQAILKTLGFSEPTEIQAKTVPLLLGPQIDFHGQAQTGTGKTLAFGLPLLHRVNPKERYTQALVVAPTRELALQITESIQPFARALGVSVKAVYGGVSLTDQISAVKRGVHLIVGTPGRINDLLERKVLSLSQLKTLVLDEADIMLDMGFREDVDVILRHAPEGREIWLFSATVKDGIHDLMEEHMPQATSVSVSKGKLGCSNTKQYYCVVPSAHRVAALCRFIESEPEFYGFVFCQTKILTSEVADQLTRRGYVVGSLHGDMSQAQRNIVIKKFRQKEYSIVVATDVAGRGIDIQDLTHVINFSLPEDFESYVHRTGRTGRAGKDGKAITFINGHQLRDIRALEKKCSVLIEPLAVPSSELVREGRMAKAIAYLESLVQEENTGSFKELDGLLQRFDQEKINSMLMHLVHDKFFKMADVDLDAHVSRESARGNDRFSTNGQSELVFFVGSDDGVTEDEILEYVLQNSSLNRETIAKIRMIRKRTFMNLPSDQVTTVLTALKNMTVGGRRINVKVAENNFVRRGGNSSSGGFRGGSARRGPFRGDFRSPGRSKRFGSGRREVRH